jgi:branched-chain amino acid transport system ATP-binding protein
MPDALLSVRGLTKSFGGLDAVAGVDFDIAEGSISALIGPNGAGKTTTFAMLCGLHKPTRGSIAFAGDDITRLAPHRICERGVGRTFQLTEVFEDMTAAENVMVGAHSRTRAGFLACGLRLPSTRREDRETRERAEELLEWVGLGEYADTPAGSLPCGRQRLLEFARAMATRPRLMLLDEPASGLDMAETDALAALVREARDGGVTVLLIEHDMRFVMGLAEWIVVIDHGRRIAQGTPEEIRRSQAVLDAYLGAAA